MVLAYHDPRILLEKAARNCFSGSYASLGGVYVYACARVCVSFFFFFHVCVFQWGVNNLSSCELDNSALLLLGKRQTKSSSLFKKCLPHVLGCPSFLLNILAGVPKGCYQFCHSLILKYGCINLTVTFSLNLELEKGCCIFCK